MIIVKNSENSESVERINEVARQENGPFQKSPKIWLLDGSTPRANFRMAEALMGAWAVKQLKGKEVLTSFALSGWDTEAGNWGLSKVSKDAVLAMEQVYKSRIRDVGNLDDGYYRGSVPISKYEGSNKVLRQRQDRFNVVGNEFGLAANTKVVDFNELTGDIDLKEFATPQLDRSSIGYFKCPCKSCHEGRIHYLKVNQGSWKVTRRFGEGERDINCKGAKAVLDIANQNVKLGALYENLGFVLNGRPAMLALAAVDSQSGVMLRDYSNPRQAFNFAQSLYGQRLAISTRLTMRDQNGTDHGFESLGLLNQSAVAEIAQAFDDNSVISRGKTVEISLSPLENLSL